MTRIPRLLDEGDRRALALRRLDGEAAAVPADDGVARSGSRITASASVRRTSCRRVAVLVDVQVDPDPAVPRDREQPVELARELRRHGGPSAEGAGAVFHREVGDGVSRRLRRNWRCRSEGPSAARSVPAIPREAPASRRGSSSPHGSQVSTCVRTTRVPCSHAQRRANPARRRRSFRVQLGPVPGERRPAPRERCRCGSALGPRCGPCRGGRGRRRSPGRRGSLRGRPRPGPRLPVRSGATEAIAGPSIRMSQSTDGSTGTVASAANEDGRTAAGTRALWRSSMPERESGS